MRLIAGPDNIACEQQPMIFLRARFLKRFGSHGQCPGGIDHIVDQYRNPILDLTDNIHLGNDIGTDPAFIDNRQRCIQARGDRARPFHAASVRRNDSNLGMIDLLAQKIQQHRRGVNVIDGNVKETLNLPRVKVNRSTCATRRLE